MAYLDKVKLPDGVTYDLQGIEYIVGTQTAATNAWTGITRSAELYTGKAIIYKLPYAGNSSAATLNLTLSGGSTTGAKAVQRLNNGNITTHYAANSVLFLVYDGDRWRHDAEYDSTNIYQLRNNNGTYLTSAALYRYQILLQKDETTLIPVSNGNNSTATGKTITTTQFDPFGEIYYYNSTVSVAANAAIGATTLYRQVDFNMSYAFNTTNTLTNNKDVYLVATPTTAGKAKLHSTPTTQALPTTDNGLIYIRLGHSRSTTNVEIYPVHPIYWYKGGSIVPWNPDGLKGVSRSGTTWTFTRNDGTTTTVAQQDNNTTYTMSISTAANSTIHLVSGSSTVANVTVPNTTNTTYGTFSTAANGLVPKPTAAQYNNGGYLTVRGGWDNKPLYHQGSCVENNTTFGHILKSGDGEFITALPNIFSTAARGLVPNPSTAQAAGSYFLKANGTWAAANYFTHPTHTAATVGPTANTTLTNGGSFTVPQVIVNSSGHVNQIIGRSMKLPTISVPYYDTYSATSNGLVPSYQSYIDDQFSSSFVINGDIVLTTDQDYHSGWNRANDFIKVKGSGTQTITSNAVTNITLSVDVFGTNPGWYGGLDTGVTIDTPGYYEVVGSAYLNPATASGLCGVFIKLDSTEQGSQYGAVGNSDNQRAMMVGPIIVKVTNSYQKLYLAARFSAKGSSTTYGTVNRGHEATFLQVKRIGPI